MQCRDLSDFVSLLSHVYHSSTAIAVLLERNAGLLERTECDGEIEDQALSEHLYGLSVGLRDQCAICWAEETYAGDGLHHLCFSVCVRWDRVVLLKRAVTVAVAVRPAQTFGSERDWPDESAKPSAFTSG